MTFYWYAYLVYILSYNLHYFRETLRCNRPRPLGRATPAMQQFTSCPIRI